MQRSDFEGLFKAMNGFPVVIRTLDPPLHEFLPKREHLMVDIAEAAARRCQGQEGDVEGLRHSGAGAEEEAARAARAR
jgi:phosphoenolpyruvate synthase/pyruvate phosphate dikinase